MMMNMIFGSSWSKKSILLWTFINLFILFHGNVNSNATLIKLPTNQATIATAITRLKINSGDISSPTSCSWTVNPGLTGGLQFYLSSFGGCLPSTTTTYSSSCYESSGVVSSNLTFLTPLTSNVSVRMECSPFLTYNLQVIVKDCTSPTPSNVPVNPPTGVYNTQAHFQCSQDSTLFYASGTSGNTATKCLASAEWENEKIVQCWSAPTATLIGNNTHCVDDKATFQCNAVGGFPLADRVEVYFNRQIQALKGNTWRSTALNSSNNGDIVECRAISKYTSIAEYNHLGRDNKILTVYYPANNPKIENKMSDLLVKSDDGYLLRSDGTLTINCSADGNPAVYCSWLCSSCVGISNTCGVTNVGVSGSTDITCVVGNAVCGGGTVSIKQRITLVPKSRIPTLIVDGMPTIASVITRNKTQSLSLGCGIESETEMKTTFLWMKDGEVKSGSNILIINNLTSSDRGLYSCNTTDAFGNFSSTIYVDVIFPAEQFKVNNGMNNVCEWMTGAPQLCSITFTLNPFLHSTMLTKDGLIVKNDIENTQQNTRIQNFLFMKNQPSENETGSYKLTVISSIFEPVDFLFTIIVSQPCKASEQTSDSVVIVGSVLASIIFILLITNAFLLYRSCRHRNAKPTAEDRNQGNINSAAADYVELDNATHSNKINQQNRTQQQHPYVNTGTSAIANDQNYMDIQTLQSGNMGTSGDGYEVVMNRNYENIGVDRKKEKQSEYEI